MLNIAYIVGFIVNITYKNKYDIESIQTCFKADRK